MLAQIVLQGVDPESTAFNQAYAQALNSNLPPGAPPVVTHDEVRCASMEGYASPPLWDVGFGFPCCTFATTHPSTTPRLALPCLSFNRCIATVPGLGRCPGPVPPRQRQPQQSPAQRRTECVGAAAHVVRSKQCQVQGLHVLAGPQGTAGGRGQVRRSCTEGRSGHSWVTRQVRRSWSGGRRGCCTLGLIDGGSVTNSGVHVHNGQQVGWLARESCASIPVTLAGACCTPRHDTPLAGRSSCYICTSRHCMCLMVKIDP